LKKLACGIVSQERRTQQCYRIAYKPQAQHRKHQHILREQDTYRLQQQQATQPITPLRVNVHNNAAKATLFAKIQKQQ
jgi:hypothetical protein